MQIRKSTLGDLNAILQIYSLAREYMRKTGNPDQWGNGYPEKEMILSDIENGFSYVIEEDGEILGTFMFFIGNEPTYQTIEGKWLNDKPYGAIHRIASNHKVRGTLKYCLDYCKTIISNLKIDTYRDNVIMQHLLEKNGFTKCGTIYLQDGSPRIAYQIDFSNL